MNKYSIEALRELYRIDAKYWETGDIDILPARTKKAVEIDEKFYAEISEMARIATQKHLPVQNLIDALYALGFEPERKEE